MTTRPTILIVDDSTDLLYLFRHIFNVKDYNLITRSTDEDLVDFIANSTIDLLLLDVLNGYHDCRHYCQDLKENPATNHFPIILMSANNQFLLNYKDYCADACIAKPFEIAELLTLVSSLLSKQ